MIGWRTWLHAAIGIGGCIFVLVPILWGGEANRLAIDQNFYLAAGSLLPLLLVAGLLRLVAMRDHAFRDLHHNIEIRARIRKVAAATDDLVFNPEKEPLSEKRKALQKEHQTTVENALTDLDDWDSQIHKTIEWLTGALIATLILFSGGIACTLLALAQAEGSNVTFAITGVAIIWMMVNLLWFEFLIFVRNPRLELSLEERLEREAQEAGIKLESELGAASSA